MTKFHLTIQTLIADESWSPSILEFVADDGSLKFCPSKPGVHPLFYRVVLPGFLSIKVPALPVGSLCARSKSRPWTRKGDQKAQMTFEDWFAHLQAINDTVHLHIPEDDCRPSIEFVDTQCESVWGPELPNKDYKLFVPSAASPSVYFELSKVTPYLIEPNLNSLQPPSSLIFGVYDGTRHPIGNLLKSTPEALRQDFHLLLKKWRVFPRLRADDFTLVLHKLVQPLPTDQPSDWVCAETDNFVLISHCLILSNGRACAVHSKKLEGTWTLFLNSATKAAFDAYHSAAPGTFVLDRFTPKVLHSLRKLKKLAWIPATASNELNRTANLFRYVVEVRLDTTKFVGAYFRTAPSVNDLDELRLKFPYPHALKPLPTQDPTMATQYAPYEGLDACAVWLRSRACIAFSPPIFELFRSELIPQVRITSSDDASHLLRSLRHYLMGREPRDDGFNLRGRLVDLDPLLERQLAPMLVVIELTANLAAVETLLDLLEKSSHQSKFLLILLVDAKMAECWVSVENTLAKIWAQKRTREVHLLDVRALVGPSEPRCVRFDALGEFSVPFDIQDPNTTLMASALTTCPLPPSDSKTVLDLIDPAVLKKAREDWLKHRRPHVPPPWELLLLGNCVANTAQIMNINLAVTQSWTSNPDRPFQILTLVKTFPASGATCLLRSVAHKQRMMASIQWIDRVATDATADTIKDELLALIGNTSQQVLICTDEIDHVSSQLLNQGLRLLVQQRAPGTLKVLWIRVVKSFDLTRFTDPTPVDGILELSDLPSVVESLSVLGHRDALEQVCKEAQAKKALRHTRHVFVFAMAASGQVAGSIDAWLREVYQDVSAFPPLRDVAMAMAMISAYSLALSPAQQLVADSPLLVLDVTAPGYDSAFLSFRKLFPPVLTHRSTEKRSACLHPFLARLFLALHYKLDWEDQKMNPEQLAKAWGDVVRTLIPYPDCHQSLNDVIVRRAPGLLFSPFIIDMLNSNKCQLSEHTVTYISESIIKPIQNIRNGHHDIFLSRLNRYMVQSGVHVNVVDCLQRAIDHAQQAVDVLASTNPGSHNQALQNQAVIFGFAHSRRPNEYPKAGILCHDILVRLLGTTADPAEYDDLIRMGRKWCSDQANFWYAKSFKTATDDPPLPVTHGVGHWKTQIKNLKRFGLFWEQVASTSKKMK